MYSSHNAAIFQTKSKTDLKSNTTLSFHLMAILGGDGVFQVIILLDLTERDRSNEHLSNLGQKPEVVLITKP